METEKEYKPRNLESLGACVGKEFFMELRGEEPLLPERREILLKGTIIKVDEVGKKVTIEIPLSNLSTLSEEPLNKI